MNGQTKRVYEFGTFRIDTANRLLLREGEPVPLKTKVIETLLVLIKNNGQVLEKDELMKQLWPSSFVEESNLTQNIYVLRKALGDSNYIETIPRRGYRFTASVRHWDDPGPDLVVRAQSRTTITIEEQAETSDTASETSMVPAAATRPGSRLRIGILALAANLAIAVVIGGGYAWKHEHSAQQANAPAIKSIAVLPLTPMGLADEEYLGLGMTDALITKMSGFQRIIVRPTSAVRKYADEKRQPAYQIGRELGVDAVLEGTIQRVDNNVRVRVQLVRVLDGRPIWAGQFDEPVTSMFKLQDSISARVTGVLALKLSADEEKSLATGNTTNAEAYQLYMKGRYFWNKRSADGVAKAADYFRQAANLDPGYARAYVGMADCYLFGQPPTMPPKILASKAKEMAEKALDIDDRLGEAHATLGLLAQNLQWNWAAAETEYKRAIELSPNYATAHQWYAEHLALLGRFDEAAKQMKIASDLDPLSLVIIKDTGSIYYTAREYDRAVEHFRKALDMDPNFDIARRDLALVYLQQGKFSEAIAELEKARGAQAEPDILSELGYAYAISGRSQEAQKMLNDLRDTSHRRYVSPLSYATIYAGLGDKEQALAWLEKGYHEDGGYLLVGLKVDPRWDSLRSDPRFANLMQQVGLAN